VDKRGMALELRPAESLILAGPSGC